MKFRTDLPETGSKNFLKLKDKESITGIFRGDLYEFFTIWENGKSRVVPEGTPNSKFRFRVNFVVREGNSYVPKIFENGAILYRQLEELHSEYQLDTIVVKITRKGTELNTEYSILPLLKQTITPETFAYLNHMPLLPLENVETPQDVAGAHSFGAPPAQTMNEEHIPF